MAANSLHREDLKTQLREAYGRITHSYITHINKMKRLDKHNMFIKYVQILFSAISTGGFIGSMITNQFILTCVGGAFSAALLVLNLYFKDINLTDESKQHRNTSDNIWLLREQYISLLTDFDVLSDSEIKAKRDELQNLTYKVNIKSPKADDKSYKAAKKSLKHGEEQFFSPDEIDKMLPAHLRTTK